MLLNKRNIVIGYFLVAIISFILLFSIYLLFFNTELNEFEVTGISKEENGYVVTFQNSSNATKYEIAVTDEESNIIYQKTTTDNIVELNDLMAKFNQKLNIFVTAYNEKKEKKVSKNILSFVWNDPSFNENLERYAVEDKDFLLPIDGDFSKDKYILYVSHEDKQVYKQQITENHIYIPYNLLKDFSGRINVSILRNSNVIAKTNIYINTVIVGNIQIITPENNLSTNWEDIEFTYSGGANATNIYINIYSGNQLQKKIVLEDETTIIDAYNFLAETDYRLEIRAVYKDYEEIASSDEVNIKIGKVLQANPVFVDYNYESIKSGTEIALRTKTEEAKIFYTTDGSDPKIFGKLYKTPITINKNLIIKAYAVKEKMDSSEINTYNFNVGVKQPVVYLSPSKQSYNKGVSSVGFTTEMAMMNKITDVVEKKLKEAGIKVYRNNPSGDMEKWTAESRMVNADLHFAIHSNGSTNHNIQGIEIYVDNQTSPALSIANKIYDNLYSIYPYQSNKTNRGVKFSEGMLKETNPEAVRVGVLIEVAYHDNKDDARWIAQNISKIGTNMADSIINYFQMN